MIHVSFPLGDPPKSKCVSITVVEPLCSNRCQDNPVPIVFGTNPENGCTARVSLLRPFHPHPSWLARFPPLFNASTIDQRLPNPGSSEATVRDQAERPAKIPPPVPTPHSRGTPRATPKLHER